MHTQPAGKQANAEEGERGGGQRGWIGGAETTHQAHEPSYGPVCASQCQTFRPRPGSLLARRREREVRTGPPRLPRQRWSHRWLGSIRPPSSQFQEGHVVLLPESLNVFNVCPKQIGDQLSRAIS